MAFSRRLGGGTSSKNYNLHWPYLGPSIPQRHPSMTYPEDGCSSQDVASSRQWRSEVVVVIRGVHPPPPPSINDAPRSFHRNPPPLPWEDGTMDGEGCDDGCVDDDGAAAMMTSSTASTSPGSSWRPTAELTSRAAAAAHPMIRTRRGRGRGGGRRSDGPAIRLYDTVVVMISARGTWLGNLTCKQCMCVR